MAFFEALVALGVPKTLPVGFGELLVGSSLIQDVERCFGLVGDDAQVESTSRLRAALVLGEDEEQQNCRQMMQQWPPFGWIETILRRVLEPGLVVSILYPCRD